MRNLSINEIEEVSGGNPIALVALALAVIVNSDKLSEFANGFFDGLGGLK
jgi:hypothetical protein